MGEELLQNESIEQSIVETTVEQDNLPLPQDAIQIEGEEHVTASKEEIRKIQIFSIPELIDEIEKFCVKDIVAESRSQIEEIRAVFYKKLKLEIEQQRQAFIQNGGKAEEFKYTSEFEEKFKDVYGRIKEFRSVISKEHEQEKQDNLAKRLALIDELKVLVNTEESIDKTFKEFRNLQDKWRQIGAIPQSEIKVVWEKYHHNVSMFYDYVKINNELRDLDLKKNFEAKIKLCENAESLLLEPQIVKSFAKLQKLHDLWREIGPVPDAKKDELWQRFKNATNQINKAHQDYFMSLKDQEKSNLEAKTVLCEKIEEINLNTCETIKQWNTASEEILNIQKLWKTIGFAPQKYNSQIYERYCAACDNFYKLKREFFHSIKAEEESNVQKRIDLCIEAEKMKTRTDWKQAATDYLQLQNLWKQIGPVSHKDSAKLWNRFRTACDEFFNARHNFYQNKETEQVQNLELKKAIIDKIEKLTLTDDAQKTLKDLQEFQKEWSEIGFIPVKKKDIIQKQYRDAIQKQFNAINLPQEQKQKALYKVKVQSMMYENQGDNKIVAEAVKLQSRIKSIENELHLLENNIGFFAKSKNAQKLIEDVEAKIVKGKQEIESIKQQLRVIHAIKDEKK